MLVLTNDLKDILRSTLQAGAQKGYKGRVEIKYLIPGFTEIGDLQDLLIAFGSVTAHLTPGALGAAPDNPSNVNDGNSLTYSNAGAGGQGGPNYPDRYWVADIGASTEITHFVFNFITDFGPHLATALTNSMSLGSIWARLYSSDDGSSWTEVTGTPGSYGAQFTWTLDTPTTARYWKLRQGGKQGNNIWPGYKIFTWGVWGYPETEIPDSLGTAAYPILSISKDKTRKMVSASADVVIDLVGSESVLVPDSVIKTSAQIDIYQWYGDNANEVRTFRGLIDNIHGDREPDGRMLRFTCRDRMKILVEDQFTATDPQNSNETGAVRTPANGVYEGYDVDDIVNDILDRCGWPSADRNIAPTNFALDEYILSDGASWDSCIIGENKLTDLVGYDAWADEDGVFQFQPSITNHAADTDTDPEPAYSYVIGDVSSDKDISPTVLRLAHEVDDDDLKTRVNVRGQIATAVPAWAQEWVTRVLSKPVGLMYVSTDSAHIYALDSGTKKIYRIRQSDRTKNGTGIWPLYIGGDVTYPIGLSGDPANSNVFWVLEAPYWTTGSTTGNKIHKYNMTTGALTASYSIASGKWTAIKVSSSNIWLSNWTTDKIHKHSKTDGSSVASYTVTYQGVNQVNPTGIFVDGTTLGLFFYGKARFLLVDESDPTTIDTTNALGVTSGKVSTAGTRLLGGEMDTTTHAHLFADSDELGKIWKYRLTTPSTNDVSVEVADQDLEDELGFLIGLADREHDQHPGDADHPFEIRRETIEIAKLLSNVAQAYDIANRNLDELTHRREVLDLGVIGNPGHQKGDLIRVVDPVKDMDRLWILDTYQDDMDEDSYIGVLSLIPYEPVF